METEKTPNIKNNPEQLKNKKNFSLLFYLFINAKFFFFFLLFFFFFFLGGGGVGGGGGGAAQ